MATSKPMPRRRRTPEAARAEILEAARGVLSGGSLEGFTVAAVMERTTLSRKAFYVYFADLAELLVALVAPLRAAADAALGRWETQATSTAAGRAALRAAAELYRSHGPLLVAVLRSPTTDPQLLQARAALRAPLFRVAEAQARAAQPPLTNPVGVAQALATMNIHRLLDVAPGASDAELDAVVDAITVIWERTLLGAEPEPAGEAYD